jgi:hypothetical protein
MWNTADIKDYKPIAVWSQLVSGVNAVNPLVAFLTIHGRKRERESRSFRLSLTAHGRLNVTKPIFNCVCLKKIKVFIIQYHRDYSFPTGSSISPRSVRFGVRSQKWSNVGQSLDGWPKINYLEQLRAWEGTINRWSRLHLQSLASTNPHWAAWRVMARYPCV